MTAVSYVIWGMSAKRITPMKRIIISTLGLALLLGLGAGIAMPAKDASAQQTQGQMPMMGQGQMPAKDASAQQTQGQMPMMGQG